MSVILVNNSTSKVAGGTKSKVLETGEQVVMCGAPIARIKFPQSSQLTISLEQRR